jgi:ketosteroid isomerase-like protein
MRESGNIETVRSIYAAFQRGDITGMLERMDETIVFTIPGSPAVPLSGIRRGIEDVRRFFEDLTRLMEFSVFEAREYLAQGNRVVALVHYEGRNRETGRSFTADSAMLWTIGNGRAIRFLEYTDTLALANAARPSDIQAHSAQ